MLAALPLELALHRPDGEAPLRCAGARCDESDLGAAMFIELDGGCRLSLRANASPAPWLLRRAVSIGIVAADGTLRHLWGPAVRLTRITPGALLPRLLQPDEGGPAGGLARSLLVCECAGRVEERAVVTLLPLETEARRASARLLIVEDCSAEGASVALGEAAACVDVAGARHRLRNHLQGLASAVRLQQADETDDTARRALDRVLTRLHGLHRAHSVLEDDGDDAGATVEFSAVARRLAESLTAIYPARVRLSLDLQAAPLARGDARMLAQALAELIGNALTHAFAGRGEGRLWLSVAADNEGVRMSVRDDGDGWAGDGAAPLARLGLTLVRRMVGDRGGAFALTRDGGVTATVWLPSERPRG